MTCPLPLKSNSHARAFESGPLMMEMCRNRFDWSSLRGWEPAFSQRQPNATVRAVYPVQRLFAVTRATEVSGITPGL